MWETASAAAIAPKNKGMGGQSGYNAPRSPMGMQPKLDALKARAVKGMPTGMSYRPPVIANKARGTQSSSTYRQLPPGAAAAMMF